MSEKPRILVVDDEPQLRRVLRTGLKARGYDVLAARLSRDETTRRFSALARAST
jgi:CheY-like chemotaxis protein